MDEAGGEVEDDHVVLARNVSAEGRSRAWVGGASVPVARLAEVAEPLVAVHGQSDQHRLLRQRAQREALDRFGGEPVLALVAAYTALHARLEASERELDEVVASARERAREADLLRFGLGEIEAVDPRPGEDAQLAADEARLGYADALRTAAEQAREALSSEGGDPDALAATSAARTLLEGVREHDSEAGALADRLAEITYLLSDVAADVASYAASVDADPTRLATVSERRAALTALTRKYGETVEEVLAWAETSAARLLDLDGTDERIETLRSEQRSLRAELGEVAQTLSGARAEAAARLSERGHRRAVAARDARRPGRDPGHPARRRRARRSTRCRAAARSGSASGGCATRRAGVDEVEFLLAANTGSELRPLHKGASGGELSRVMLALEVALAGTSPVPTFVFDEVDSGVGGTAAVEVGRRLAQLARTAQVLVVTHLPQVAAYADRHVLVEKASDGSVTSSGLTVLDEAGPGARAVPDAGRDGRVGHRAGARTGAAGGGRASPGTVLTD